MDDDRALSVRGGSHGDGARARRRCLSHSALPDARGDLPRPVDARNLHVGAIGKACMRLEQQADAADLARVADDDGMRVPDRDRNDRQTVDQLGMTDLEWADVLLDPSVGASARSDLALADADTDGVEARPLGKPARDDPGAVAGHLGLRTVGVPDHDLGRVALDRDDLENAIRVATCRLDLGRSQRPRKFSSFDEEIAVAGGLPGREFGGRCHGACDRRGR